MPKVSVIVPNFNHAAYLDKRIESILGQNFQDFELLLFDDCSSDNSLEVLEKYRNNEKVSHFIVNQINSGSTFIQWIKGVELAKGEYIWIAESDDYSDPRFLSELTTSLEDNPSAALSYCQSIIVDENNEFIRNNIDYTNHLDADKWLHDYVNPGHKEINEGLMYKNTIPNASAILFRKQLLTFPESLTEYKYMGDWYLYCSLLVKHDIAYISDSLNFYRKHSGSVRSRHEQNGVSELEYFRLLAYLKHLKILSPSDIHDRVKVNLKRWLLKAMGISPKMHYRILKSWVDLARS